MPAAHLAGSPFVSRSSDAAVRLVAEGLRCQPPATRPLFLRALLAHAAAGLTLLEGDAAASEVIYRLGDAMAVRTPPKDF